MGDSWCYLLHRYGEETGTPTPDEIAIAVKKLYEENLPGMTEGDYDEHGDASLRFGHDDGPMYVLTPTRHGNARWEEWADQDYEVELCPMKEAGMLSQEKGILLWEQLAAGKIDIVRTHFQPA